MILQGTGNGKVHIIISLSSSPPAVGDFPFSSTPSIPLYISPLSPAQYFQAHPSLFSTMRLDDTVALRACETRLVRANPYTVKVQRPLLRPIATACYQRLNYNVSWTKRQAVFITRPPFPSMAELRSGASAAMEWCHSPRSGVEL